MDHFWTKLFFYLLDMRPDVIPAILCCSLSERKGSHWRVHWCNFGEDYCGLSNVLWRKGCRRTALGRFLIDFQGKEPRQSCRQSGPDRVYWLERSDSRGARRGDSSYGLHTSYAPDYIRQVLLHLKVNGAENVGGPAGDSLRATYRPQSVPRITLLFPWVEHDSTISNTKAT